jgi:hypothetical protein
MLAGIFNILPDWMMGAVAALLVWFGLNYIWIAPEYFTHWRLMQHVSCRATDVVRHGAPHKTDMALHTASFGLIGDDRSILLAICAEASQ